MGDSFYCGYHPYFLPSPNGQNLLYLDTLCLHKTAKSTPIVFTCKTQKVPPCSENFTIFIVPFGSKQLSFISTLNRILFLWCHTMLCHQLFCGLLHDFTSFGINIKLKLKKFLFHVSFCERTYRFTLYPIQYITIIASRSKNNQLNYQTMEVASRCNYNFIKTLP